MKKTNTKNIPLRKLYLLFVVVETLDVARVVVFVVVVVAVVGVVAVKHKCYVTHLKVIFWLSNA